MKITFIIDAAIRLLTIVIPLFTKKRKKSCEETEPNEKSSIPYHEAG